MNLPVVFLPEAQAEFDQAADWYEEQKPGLGADFLAAVRKVVQRIEAAPALYAVVRKSVRMGMVERFPYAIFYRIEQDRILVISVFHTSRDPKIWRRRV
jgi:plasmid stabilization system protein ParE